MRYLTPFRWGKWVPEKSQEEHPVVSFQRAVNSLFDDFFKGIDIDAQGEKFGSFNPKIDMTEDEKSIKVTAELPGIEEKDIEVNLTKNILTVKGEKAQEKEEKGKESYYMERSYGSFQRSIQLPTEIQHDKIDANFKKGVLTITLPKAEIAIQEQKKIKVKSE